jgi:integrase
LGEYLSGELLSAIDYDAILELRTSCEGRISGGNGRKTVRSWKPATVNRVLAVLAAILERCASDDWKRMLPAAPNVPLLPLPKTDPKWISREQAQQLLERLPEHSADMMRFALATGLRRSNVTDMEWSRIDIERRCCYVPGYESKTGEPIPVPLNSDAGGTRRCAPTGQ